MGNVYTRNLPAYPTENWNGLTKREIFAKDAPPAPSWFKYESKLIPPKAPTSWSEISRLQDSMEGFVEDWNCAAKGSHYRQTFFVAEDLQQRVPLL